MSYNLTDLKIQEASFSANKTLLKMHHKKPLYEIHLAEITLLLNFRYSIISRPDLMNDTGSGFFLLRNFNLSLLASPFEKNGATNFKLH